MANSMVLVDGVHLSECGRALDVSWDFKRMLGHFRNRRDERLVRAYYVTPVLPLGETDYLRKLIDWMHYNGFAVVERVCRTGENRDETSIAVALATVALTVPDIEVVHMFIGHDQYVPMIAALKMRGVQVHIYSCHREMSLVDDALRRVADVFVDLGDLVPVIGKDAD